MPLGRAAQCPLAPPAEFTSWRQEPGLRRAMWNGQPTWIVSRHQDIRAALVDPRLSAETLPEMFDSSSGNAVPVMFARTDDPEHHRLRRMMSGHFTFRRTEAMRPQIQQLVDKYLDAMIDKGPPADLVRDFGLPVPSMVIALLLGVPPEDLELFQHNTSVGMDGNSTDGQRTQAFIGMYQYIQELVARKERDPGDDLISRLITDYVATGQLDYNTVAVNGVIMMQAGH
jgi:cytochrome P450